MKDYECEFIWYKDVKRVPITFLWKPYIPRRMVSVLEGDGGMGKGYILLGIADAVSNGVLLPHSSESTTGTSILFDSEDTDGTVSAARLDLMDDGNPSIGRVNGTMPLNRKDGMEYFVEIITKYKPVLVGIDPITAYVDEKFNINNGVQVRILMTQLTKVAFKYNCSIIIVNHLAKDPKSKAIYQGAGSVQISAAARSVISVSAITDPMTELTTGTIYHIKANVGIRGFDIGYKIDKGIFSWCEETTPYSDMLALADPTAGCINKAVDFLREELSGGEVYSPTLHKNAEEQGVSKPTLHRASSQLGVLKRKEKGRVKGQWLWRLPDDTSRLTATEKRVMRFNK